MTKGGSAIRRVAYYARLAASAKTGHSSALPKNFLPTLATINLTENCQSRCLMCDYWRESKTDGIDLARATSLVGELRSLGVSSLRFLGGEPLLRKDLFLVLDGVRQWRFGRITLATNGLLLSRYSTEINRSPITNITVSLDGFGTWHDDVRGVPGGFDKIIEGLEQIRGKRIKIGALASSQLAGDLDSLLALCAERDWDFDLVLPSYDLPYAKHSQTVTNLKNIWPSPDQSREILTKVSEHGHISGSMAAAALRYLVDRVYPQSRCVMGYVHIQVRANGDLLTGCYELEPLGNVVQHSVREIVSSSAFRQRLEQMFRMDCPKCVCGWQLSYAAERPVSSLMYLRKRTGRLPSAAERT